jgi:glutamate-1-semialdehyde 2,1-aminomutase
MLEFNNSIKAYSYSRSHLAGGVNSPSRSYDAVGGSAPIFIKRGEGAYLWDVDGNRYIDYLCAYGALLLGHAHPNIVKGVTERIKGGSVYGAPTEYEVHLAEGIKKHIPFIDLLRFTVSGTEAVMTALRLARAYTKRDKILKFDGSYHGHSDPVLISAGSGSSTLNIDESLGIPHKVKEDIISVPFNNITAVEEVIAKHGSNLAAILVEPIVGNFGIVPPHPGYLEALSDLAHSCGAVVIWDEVITAFRFRPGSIQPFYKTTPDLVTLGKLIGGGLPIGAYGGKEEIMSLMAPLGGVYQDGTMAGNPLSMSAGLAFIKTVTADTDLYPRIFAMAKRLEDGLKQAGEKYGIPIWVGRFGGALSPYFTDKPVYDFAGCEKSDSRLFSQFFHNMLQHNINLAPSKYEAWFVSAAHSEQDIDLTLEAINDSFSEMAKTV